MIKEKNKGKKINTENVVLIGLLIVLMATIIFSIYTIFGHSEADNTASNYQKALQAENPSNICATPAGYTDEEWKQHMSHHPDRYRQCLA